MTKSERNQIIKWANTLTNEELEKEYYDAVFDTLGSEAEEMYERGWDMADSLEREKFEKWLGQKSRLLEKLCEERGIKLWDESINEEYHSSPERWAPGDDFYTWLEGDLWI
jgi:hypothetical protein